MVFYFMLFLRRATHPPPRKKASLKLTLLSLQSLLPLSLLQEKQEEQEVQGQGILHKQIDRLWGGLSVCGEYESRTRDLLHAMQAL